MNLFINNMVCNRRKRFTFRTTWKSSKDPQCEDIITGKYWEDYHLCLSYSALP